MWSNLPEYPHIKSIAPGKFVATRRNKEVSLSATKHVLIDKEIQKIYDAFNDSAPTHSDAVEYVDSILKLLSSQRDAAVNVDRPRLEILESWDKLTHTKVGDNMDARVVAKRVELSKTMHQKYPEILGLRRMTLHKYRHGYVLS